MAGIAWQHNCTLQSLTLFVGCSAIFAIIAFFVAPKKFLFPLFFAVTLGCLGALRYLQKNQNYNTIMQAVTHRQIAITGTIDTIQKSPHKQTVTIKLIGAKSLTEQIPCQGALIQLDCFHTADFTAGDSIQIPCLYLETVASKKYSSWFWQKNIVGTGIIQPHHALDITKKEGLAAALEQKKLALVTSLQHKLSPQTFSLVGSIFFGYPMEKSAATKTLRQKFSWWGISHYLARSGLHLVLFVLLLQLFLSFLPLPLLVKQSLSLATILLYAALSWTSTSFLRALIMVCCYFFCSLSTLQQHTLHIIALTCFAMLLYNPFYLFALDFQLSMGLTCALAVLQDAHFYQKVRRY